MIDTTGPQFVLGGWRYGTSPYDQGTRGLYWSSLAHTSATSAYELYLRGTDSTVVPADNYYKRAGFTLRCLGKKGITTLKTLFSPPATPPENSNHSTTNIQPMIKCVSIQWGWCREAVIFGMIVVPTLRVLMVYTGPTVLTLAVVKRIVYICEVALILYIRLMGMQKYSVTPSAASPAVLLLLLLFGVDKYKNQKGSRVYSLNPSASQPVTLLENTKHSTITIIAILL